jgi:hypothetical protein
MKSLLLFVTLLCAVALGTGSSFISKASNGGQKQRAIITFNEPVRLQGVMLKGEYLFVHDNEAMMRGEACTFIYKGNAEVPENLVVSFHCVPVKRTKVGNFTVRTAELSPGFVELREFQFANETEAHLAPPVK